MLVDKSSIADCIRSARLSQGLSQVALAERLGVTQGTISRAERGDGDIRLGTLLELTRALDLDVIVIKRSQRPLIARLAADTRRGPTAIYTGMGEEPYIDDVDLPSALESSQTSGVAAASTMRRLRRATPLPPRGTMDDP